jgi:hypothetical protein
MHVLIVCTYMEEERLRLFLALKLKWVYNEIKSMKGAYTKVGKRTAKISELVLWRLMGEGATEVSSVYCI